jgi:hypothetical protein
MRYESQGLLALVGLNKIPFKINIHGRNNSNLQKISFKPFNIPEKLTVIKNTSLKTSNRDINGL